VATTLAWVTPADAITYGLLDGNAHPNVGGLVAATQYSDGTWLYCSGTLISPTVVLTAAHCDDDGTRVRVTFDTAYVDGDVVYAGTFHAHPDYNHSMSDPNDIAVIVLDTAVDGIAPAQLPTAGSLSKPDKDQQFVSVGYGAYEVVQGQGKTLLYDDVRRVATGTLNSVNPAWLRISMNPSHGDGGTCYGDSGGPNFLGTSSIVAGVTVTGDMWCRSTNVVYRTDTPSARTFLDEFVALP
jgi:secreted trypsin-like serine protease